MKLPKLFFLLALAFIVFAVSESKAAGKCSDANGPLAALIKSGSDSPTKTPLILIHGIQATQDKADVETDNQTWFEFLKLFNAKESLLSSRYSIYLFQYCSDREPVSVIAGKLRDLIDQKLAGRDQVIVAHSMGGLVAKSYIGETQHTRGDWKGKKGGDTTIGLITLATPHHGTPGANDPVTMKSFVPDKFEAIYNAAQRYYWRSKKGSVRSPSIPNRSDLRWDNYDRKLDARSKDINTDLASSNASFEPFTAKLIAYGGTTASTLSKFETAALLLETQLGGDQSLSDHRMLTFANIGLVNGLDRHFGDADGLVPLVSSLFCRAETAVTPGSLPSNYICTSRARVRRFEPGGGGEIAASQLPDPNTLSIFRTGRGFDHLDMLANGDVLKYLIRDLASMIPAPVKNPPLTTTKVKN